MSEKKDIGEERLDTVRSHIEDFKRKLDLKTALLERQMTWKTKSGEKLTLKYRRFVDAVNKKLILQQVSIVSDKDTELMVKAGIDADIRTNGNDHYTNVECSLESGNSTCKVTTGGNNTIEVTTTMLGWDWKGETGKRSCCQVKEFNLAAGKELILEKRSAYSTDRDPDGITAGKVIKNASSLDFGSIFNYEPLCTHDSSLSPGVHGLIALRLGLDDKAWEFWKYTAGLDLDIEKEKASQGIHIACSAATWQMAVFGFAGVRPATEKDVLTLEPRLPEKWKEISFPFVWKGQKVMLTMGPDRVSAENLSVKPLKLCLYESQYIIRPEGKMETSYQKG